MLNKIKSLLYPKPTTPEKTWAASQSYELDHAIIFMKEPSFQQHFQDFVSGKMMISKGYKSEILMKEFFSGPQPERELSRFFDHVAGKKCMDIGPCVFTPIATWDTASELVVIEPLYKEIDSWQRTNLGKSVFENVKCYAVGAEEFLTELAGAIDGAIYCRNMLDHTPNWVFTLSNISAYAKSGCRLLLWADIDHRGQADMGHYDITPDPATFRRLITQLGFRIEREYKDPKRLELNYGCFAIKN